VDLKYLLSNIFTFAAVERDGQIIISGRGPEAAEEFGNLGASVCYGRIKEVVGK